MQELFVTSVFIMEINNRYFIWLFDAISLKRSNKDNYTATISLAILSQNGAEGVLGAAVAG